MRSRARSASCPAACENLTVVKSDADAEPVLQLAVSSDTLAIDELSRVVEDRIEPELVSVPGVADVTAVRCAQARDAGAHRPDAAGRP